MAGTGAQIDTTTPKGRLCFGIFAALAEFERELIIESTRAGLPAPSKVRMKLFTLDSRLIVKKIGGLAAKDQETVKKFKKINKS